MTDKLSPVSLFREMLRIRRIEEAIAERYAEQEMRCPMHLCIGQEAVAVGVCAALEPTDVVFSNHRAHGHYLAKGGDLNAMIAELYGLSSGCCGGRGGSMHLIDLPAGFMGATPIVGGTVPLAVGAAWAAKLKDEPRVSVIFFGDGCFEEGVMHESMNFACLHQLPVIFVCENNGFSVYTPLAERQMNRPIHKVATAHGLNTFVGDGNDVNEVLALAQSAIHAARQGGGPQFIELGVYRWREHCGPNFDNELRYRSEDDITSGMAACPVNRHLVQLKAQNLISQDALHRLEDDIKAEIAASFEFSQASTRPLPSEAKEHVYA